MVKNSFLPLIVCIFSLFCTNNLFAEVLRPIQIMFPGNLNGDLITFTAENEAKSSQAFKLPYLIKKFCKDKTKDIIIFGLGNDSNAFKPFSYLTRGKAERDLLDKTRPLASAVSPNDLEVFNNSYLPSQIKERIFTNVESPEERTLIFKRLALKKLGKSNFYFFNFITPEYSAKLPLSKWSEITVDDPCRALRKINLQTTNNDYTISVLYGNKASAVALARELKELKGLHFIINVPINGEPPLFSTLTPEKEDNIFKFSVQPGHLSLPMLNIIPKTAGHPRTTLRMIPFDKFQENNAKKDFKTAWGEFRQMFHQPQRVIPTTSRATTSANRISLQAHAEMLKYATNTELAFLKLPVQRSFTDNVITVGNIITRFPNDRIIRFKATEPQLKEMFMAMLQSNSIKNLGFAGCQFSVLGVSYWDFKINHKSFGNGRRYSIATTETTTKEQVVAKILKQCDVEPYDGLTLWELWKENLRTFKAPDEKLFSK